MSSAAIGSWAKAHKLKLRRFQLPRVENRHKGHIDAEIIRSAFSIPDIAIVLPVSVEEDESITRLWASHGGADDWSAPKAILVCTNDGAFHIFARPIAEGETF
jgi:hypothetical protein